MHYFIPPQKTILLTQPLICISEAIEILNLHFIFFSPNLSSQDESKSWVVLVPHQIVFIREQREKEIYIVSPNQREEVDLLPLTLRPLEAIFNPVVVNLTFFFLFASQLTMFIYMQIVFVLIFTICSLSGSGLMIIRREKSHQVQSLCNNWNTCVFEN